MGKKKHPTKKKPKLRQKSAPHRSKKAAPKPKPSRPKKHIVANKPSKSQPSSRPPKPAKEAAPSKSKPAATRAEPPAAAAASRAPDDASASRLSPDELRKQLVAKARARTKAQRPAAFTLDDVRGELARSTAVRGDASRRTGKTADGAGKTAAGAAAAAVRKTAEAEAERRRFGAASLADILGYNPTKDERPEDEEAQIDKRFVRYYRLLAQLRDHLKSGLALHAEDTLKRSNREDSGDLSGYGQHMADAGTDNFDRDFALSLVSNEQEALFEIEEAIKRIKNGTYGICELTGKPISKDRLLAVPFARYSVESQTEIEKYKRRSSQRGGVFSDTATEEGAKLLEEDAE